MNLVPLPLPLPDPPLADAPVTLRPWTPEDAPELAAAWADSEIRRWTGVPERADETAAGLWITGECDRRARGLALDFVVDVGGVVCGEIGIARIDLAHRTAEIGWWIAPAHRGRGLAGQAARLLAPWALSELIVEALTARCHPDNPASASVARSAGFVPAGTSGEFEVWRCC